MSSSTTPLVERTAGTERVTRTLARDVELPDGLGTLVLLTLDNGEDHRRPTTLGPGGLTGLRDVLLGVRDRVRAGEVAAVAVTGKPFYLAAGADLRIVGLLDRDEDALAMGRLGHEAYGLLHDMGVPTFAYVNGAALGGGLELALACTYRTVSADVSALALPETYLGLVPGWGGCTLLPRLVGIRAALDLILDRPLANNRRTSAGGALRIGLVDSVLEPADFLERSVAWTADVLAGREAPRRPDPDDDATWAAAVEEARARLDARLHGSRRAPYAALELVAASRTRSVADSFAAEDEVLAELLMSDELRASLYAFDLVTRKARTPAGAPDPAMARPVRRVGIVGAGLMARQLAVVLARGLRVPVAMREVDDERVRAGLEGIRSLVEGMVAKGRLDETEGRRILASVTVSTDLADLGAADLVIEAVTEVMAVKQQVLAQLEEVVPQDTVLATNTSALSVAEMSGHLRHPERVVGLHFFNPVAQMPLVEVVRSAHANDAAVATAFAVTKDLRKTAVGVADRPGFVVNRLLLRMLADVAAAVETGTPVEVADRALRPLGLPMGPFALIQLVGLPVALHVLRSLHEDLGDRYPLSPGLEQLARDDRRVVPEPDGSGREHGVDPAIQDVFGAPGREGALDEQGVRDRVLRGLAEEVGLILDEGVVGSPDQVDLAMLLGAGWPLHMGGITPYLDRTGHAEAVVGRRFHEPGVADVPRRG